jgi:peptidoglycan/xylan/chitin deacetylase (PgdA/CDA1 family)
MHLFNKHFVFAIFLIAIQAINTPAIAQNACKNPIYLTLDTGHMEVAPVMADVMRRHQVRATFFVANEPTKTGNGSLSNTWGTWWKSIAAQGHEFASHTYDHVYWRGDLPGVQPRFRMRPSAGAFAGREFTWEPAKYCEQIRYAAERIEDFTGKKPLPLFRAPGGKTSTRLLAAARTCGYEHVGWSAAGMLGDELPSEKFSNEKLLTKALKDIRTGDILMAHLGIWSRNDPWAPANFEPLIVGLKERGFCFETLRNHPAYRDWIASHGG